VIPRTHHPHKNLERLECLILRSLSPFRGPQVLIKATRILILTTQQELTPDGDFNHQIVSITMQQDTEDQSTSHWSIRCHH